MDVKVKQKFKIWGRREGNLNMTYVWFKALVFGLKKHFGKGYSHAFCHFEGEIMTWCEDFDDLREVAEHLLTRLLQDKEDISRIYHSWQKDAEVFLAKTRELFRTNFKEKSNQELLKLHNEAMALNAKITRAYITDVLQFHLEGVIRQGLAGHLPESDPRFNSCYSALAAPVGLSLASEEEIDLLKIAKMVVSSPGLKGAFQQDPEINKLIENHTEEFFWLGGNYTGKNCFDKAYFIEKLKEHLQKSPQEIEKEIQAIASLPEKAKKAKQKIARELNLDQEFLAMIEVSEKIVTFHDERKKILLAPILYLVPLQNEIAKRLGITRDGLVWLTPPEISEALRAGRVNFAEVKKRGSKGAFYVSTEGEVLVTGDEADKLFEQLVIKETASELKGNVANTGKAKGVVKVVKTVKEISKVEKGDILVASMTTPDYVPAMRLAGAIVTDEGGITCHAAIVSRELGIPCIIGTKIATQALKDGDVVEVDADKGIVRILEK